MFWNIADRTECFPHVGKLVRKLGINLLLLAECPSDVAPLFLELPATRRRGFREEANYRTKVRAFTSFKKGYFTHLFSNAVGDLSIWRLGEISSLANDTTLVAGVHFPSKAGGLSQAAQASITTKIVPDISDLEDSEGHVRSLVVGDFNMNPFDEGMTLVTGMHALMSRDLADGKDRRFRSIDYRRFYNPMWGLLGDRTPGPPGGYYWDSSAIQNTHWAILDQLLVRPSLIDQLLSVRFVENDGTESLLDEHGVPTRQFLSDHLPLVFVLDV